MSTKWSNVSAGPIQVKRIEKALSGLKWEAKTFNEISGVVGRSSYESTLTSPFTVPFPERVAEADALIAVVGERYGFAITKDNAKNIVADLEGARVKLAANRPTKDERISAEKDDERQAAATIRRLAAEAEKDQTSAARREVEALKPAGAHALIVAQLKVDNSDSQTDYFNNTTAKTVAIGWRFSKREDFKALAAAAASYEGTKDVTFTEHRDNYSMGHGNYLSDHGWDGSGSGWVIKSMPFPLSTWDHITDVAIKAPATPAVTTSSEGVTITPSSLGREGVIEVRFDAKPDAETLLELKLAGFRWARTNRCWYGQESRLPRQYKVGA